MREEAAEYFSREAEQYAERYVVHANGDVLWGRHRAIVEMVLGSGLPRGSKILDLGCGPGFLSRDLASQAYRGVGIDAAAGMIEYCRTQATAARINHLWQYQLGDVEAIPAESKSFDLAISAGVIEYLRTDENFLSEVSRVLKPGGRFILCVTNKYGYTVSLHPVLHAIKKLPGAITAASFLRRVLVGGTHGAMDFAFLPRKHRPSQIRELLRRHRFRMEADRYVQFTLLPAPFCVLLSKLKLSFEEKLEVLNRTPLRIIGSCYILDAIKEN